MGQAHALTSIAIPLTMVMVGLVMAVVFPTAWTNPVGSAWAAAIALLLGFGVFLLAKASVIRRGHLVTMGTGPMSRGHRWLYRAGYCLMILGMMLCLGVAAASRGTREPDSGAGSRPARGPSPQ